MSDQSERRAHKRFPMSFEFETGELQDGSKARLLADNLSVGGLHCTSDVGFEEMSRLGVRIMLPQTDDATTAMSPFDVEAVVVRSREVEMPDGDTKYELALFFNKMEDEQRNQLKQYLGS